MREYQHSDHPFLVLCYNRVCVCVQLFSLSEHLCSWGLAEVICTISSKSIYQVSSNAKAMLLCDAFIHVVLSSLYSSL